MPGSLALIYPQALVLGLLLAWLYWRHARRRNFWRALMLIIAILLLGYPLLVYPRRGFDLFVLVDRSRSISAEARQKELELLDLTARQLKPGDRLGIVSFNEKAHLELLGENPSALKSFANPYSEDASDLAEGLSLILSQARGDRHARVLVLSDGEYTGADPEIMAHRARQTRVPIHYRNLARSERFNLVVRDAQLPAQVNSREPFLIQFTVGATTGIPGRYRVYRNGRVIGEERDNGWRAYDFQEGVNQIEFQDSLQAGGIHAYRLEVESVPAGREPFTSDNVAERFLTVVGERPLLLVNNGGARDNVASILEAGGLAAHVVAISDFHMDMAALSRYKAVILNNVPLLGLSLRQIEGLRDFVLQEGGGMLVCGGTRSFGAGGYYKSELEPVLPVSLEDREQSRRVSTAFSIVLDRSGSMAMTVPSGETKMTLANTAAGECVGLMSSADSLSVIAVDSAPHVVVEQQPVSDGQAIVGQISTIESMGGGIFVHEGLVAAGDQILRASQINKHILLFADAADAEEPGDYKQLLADYAAAGVTVSVVGLGTEADPDAALLREIAALGGGTAYFTEDARQLVQFFTADTLAYTRNSFVSDPAPMQIRAGALALAPGQQWADFNMSHFNLLFARPGAEIAIMTANEDRAPIVAFWQRGLGRVGSLALDPEGPFSADAQYGDIMLALARWTISGEVEDRVGVTTDYEGNAARIRVELSDDERAALGNAELTIFTPDGRSIRRPLAWEGHDTLAASFKLENLGLHRAVLKLGERTMRLGPLSLPASPEFQRDLEPDFGRRTLARLAEISGGREILDVRELFVQAPLAQRRSPIVTPLLIALLVIFLFEIAEPRFGLLDRAARAWSGVSKMRLGRRRETGISARSELSNPDSAPEAPAEGEAAANSGAAVTGVPAPDKPPVAAESGSSLSYLAKSKEQAGRRIRRQ